MHQVQSMGLMKQQSLLDFRPDTDIRILLLCPRVLVPWVEVTDGVGDREFTRTAAQ